MDRGKIHSHVPSLTAENLICRYDLGDEGARSIFIAACQSLGRPMYSDRTDVALPDSPVEMDDRNATWPEVTNIDELDRLIAALQAERAWIAETDPEKRHEL